MAAREAAAPSVFDSRSLFDLPPDFFESCRLLSDPREIPAAQPETHILPSETTAEEGNGELKTAGRRASVGSRWLGLAIHVKLQISGRNVINEEDFDELGCASLSNDFDVSSISGSEEELDDVPVSKISTRGQERVVKQKLYIRLQSGGIISLWKCLLLDDSEDISYGNLNQTLRKLLNRLTQEPRDKTQLRTVLLACGGHFAGCIFDGNSVIAHKTFHRYVVRAKAGKKQSAKDATGKAASSAGSSLRRYNEVALKKNHQLLFEGEKLPSAHLDSAVRHIPITVRRPTFKEAKRIYSIQEAGEESSTMNPESKDTISEANQRPESSGSESPAAYKESDKSIPDGGTPLHEAARSGDEQRTLELLEQGLDPCVRDSRGRTPYMVASEKEVRNTFRRFMALNLDKWDWHAANVPSPLTKEMEESQAAKQAEKDAKRKAKAKELKKLRKAKERAKDELQREREKRAAAAERRIAAMKSAGGGEGDGGAAGLCSFCGTSLAGLVPFHRYHYSYCSSSCMHVHREVLESG
ncbi:unnamed protein product [Spirodela intermedia]|uniref:VLRF1 domain-containing protein n=1 Tax=Spirodela intermedia TaxID=51605 RepID=A0A7I8JVE1_SPIIN|nr:unnamed protein product [Spirodela intermedia]CAA6673603.1 unnamed protein product [Spirodela intermedia]